MVHEDRISKLPSDILISIISQLSLREATATSILSTGWRHLQSHVSHLNFPVYRDGIDRISDYVGMVNHVLSSHRGSRIKELRVDISGYRGGKSRRWFEFALTKKAEIIHIRMAHGVQFLRLSNTILSHGLECLKELSLSYIEVNDLDFELLVSNCLALECLTIESSIKLENVSIAGLSKLKHLTLSHVREVGSIVIRDVISLVSLTCYGLRSGCAVQLSNLPKLTKLDFEEGFDRLSHVELLSGMPSCIRGQLQLMRLSTNIYSKGRFNHMFLPHLSVELLNIKHIELVINTRMAHHDMDFLNHIARLVEACRSLEKLVIKFPPDLPYGFLPHCNKVLENVNKEASLKHLEIEIIGCSASALELELVVHAIIHVRALTVANEVIYDIFHQLTYF